MLSKSEKKTIGAKVWKKNKKIAHKRGVANPSSKRKTKEKKKTSIPIRLILSSED